MRTITATLAFLAATAASAWAQQKEPKPIPWAGYNRGVKWETSFDDALRRARETNRPVLVYQLVGDLRLEGC